MHEAFQIHEVVQVNFVVSLSAAAVPSIYKKSFILVF